VTAHRKTEPGLVQFIVPYRFDTSKFHAVVMAKDAEDAKLRALAWFRRDAYPMDRVEILGAVPHSLVEGQ